MSTSLECHREGVNGEVGMDCMRGGQRRKHIVVCRVDGNTVNLNIGNMIADIRRNRVFRRIAAVVCRITDRSNCAMRASRGGNDRLHRERNDRRGRLCAKHRHDRAVGTTDDEVFYSVAIHIAITETRTVGKPNIVGEHADRCCAAWQGGQSLISTLVGRDAPIAPFTQIRPHVTGRVARNDVGKAIMVDVSHNRRGASVRNDQCRSIHIRENRHAVRAGRRITRNDAYTPIHAASDKYGDSVVVVAVHSRSTGFGRPLGNDPSLCTEYGDEWYDFFGIAAQPAAMINRQQAGGTWDLFTPTSNFDDRIEAVVNAEPELAMSIKNGAENEGEDYRRQNFWSEE